MSVYLIKIEKRRKVARPVTTEAEYRLLRNNATQIANLQKARQGDADAKRRLIQFNYSGHYPQGFVKGNRLPSQAFGFDVDDPKEFARIARQLLEKPQQTEISQQTEKPQQTEKTRGTGDTPQTLAEKLGLLMMERSARQGGHCVFEREKGKTILENQVRIATLLRCEIDTNAHDINRVYFSTSASPDDLLYLSPRLFDDQYNVSPGAEAKTVEEEAQVLEQREREGREELPEGAHNASKHFRPYIEQTDAKHIQIAVSPKTAPKGTQQDEEDKQNAAGEQKETGKQKEENEQKETGNKQEEENKQEEKAGIPNYLGIPYQEIIAKWWQLYNGGRTPVRSNRDVLTFELAVNLRHICGFDRALMDKVIPCYDNFPEAQKLKCIDSALGEKRTQMPLRLRSVLTTLRNEHLRLQNDKHDDLVNALDESQYEDDLYYAKHIGPKARPQGIRDSLNAAEPRLAMPVLTAICPAIGMLASDVKVMIHGKPSGLNLIAYIAGDFASGKGSIDPIIDAWLQEVKRQDDGYLQQEIVWREKKRQAKNAKEQPHEPKLPVRYLTLNNTVANLAERLANTRGKHAFSFTPEADTVALKWKQNISDFSIMLRQAYDGSRYERETRSVDAVSAYIPHLLWNVTMCGTPDALYRVVSNYVDGFQSRIAIARTPDNTYTPLSKVTRTLTSPRAESIREVAHLLPLMTGTVDLPKLEAKGEKWLESIRLEAMKADDPILARQRFRICVTAQRMTVCVMLCAVCEKLIKENGSEDAEKMLKQQPSLWQDILAKAQTPALLNLYDLIADSLLENALFFFRARISKAMFQSASDHECDRSRRGRNDNIYDLLPSAFTMDQAYQQALTTKGNETSYNSVQQMVKNWCRQGLAQKAGLGYYNKK